jgi:hypothetical protein
MSFLLRGVGWRYVPALILLCIATSPACAGGAKVPDTGDTAWVLVASALVLFMTLPGLALFYGGLVRARNLLSVLMIAPSFAASSRCSGRHSATVLASATAGC